MLKLSDFVVSTHEETGLRYLHMQNKQFVEKMHQGTDLDDRRPGTRNVDLVKAFENTQNRHLCPVTLHEKMLLARQDCKSDALYLIPIPKPRSETKLFQDKACSKSTLRDMPKKVDGRFRGNVLWQNVARNFGNNHERLRGARRHDCAPQQTQGQPKIIVSNQFIRRTRYPTRDPCFEHTAWEYFSPHPSKMD